MNEDFAINVLAAAMRRAGFIIEEVIAFRQHFRECRRENKAAPGQEDPKYEIVEV
jgi:hypothetical protein